MIGRMILKVSKRNGFSDRYAIKPENVEIQLKDFDARTRVQLRNMISQLYTSIYGDEYYGRKEIQTFLMYVLGNIYAEPVDTTRMYDLDRIFEVINKTIAEDEYDDVLTLIEAIVQYWDEYLKEDARYYNEYTGYTGDSLYDVVNEVFEREYIGYRFIAGLITPISDKNEVEAIRAAVQSEYQPVADHLLKANVLLADREHPDYENSIKESISAVEAICEIIIGAHGSEATLGKMLKKLEDKGVTIHTGLRSAFNILYGYTSDANGIRHAGNIGGPSSTFEEAKFMLVSCSAFINYLKALCA